MQGELMMLCMACPKCIMIVPPYKWKYITEKGMNIGIDRFGESAPYKDVYNHLGLSEEKITDFIQKKLRE